MTREEKTQIIEELSKKFASTANFYITDASGLTVDHINKFRKLCYQRGVEYKVIKNTLIKKALASLDADFSGFEKTVLKGSSGVLFSEVGKVPANLLKDFYKSGAVNDRPKLKGASINTALYIGEDNLDALSNLKSKEEMIGEIIGLLQSPAKNVISALQSGGNKLAGIVKTLSEKK
jgi:large subunit ribosomal protein L10